MSLLRVVPLALVIMSGIPAAALAQDAAPGAGPGGPGHAAGGWDPARMRQHMEARRAERDKALHDVLGIQASQETAFATFTAAMSAGRHEHGPGETPRGDRMERPDRGMALTTPQRLDQRKAEMDRHVAEMRDAFDKRAQATKALYAALDPHQRAVMDALPELTGRGRHGEHGGPGERMGRMGPPPSGSGM